MGLSVTQQRTLNGVGIGAGVGVLTAGAVGVLAAGASTAGATAYKAYERIDGESWSRAMSRPNLLEKAIAGGVHVGMKPLRMASAPFRVAAEDCQTGVRDVAHGAKNMKGKLAIAAAGITALGALTGAAVGSGIFGTDGDGSR